MRAVWTGTRRLWTLALALWGGSVFLNAEVNALERLQMVRGRNSLYFGSKWRSCTVRARCFESFEFCPQRMLRGWPPLTMTSVPSLVAA